MSIRGIGLRLWQLILELRHLTLTRLHRLRDPQIQGNLIQLAILLVLAVTLVFTLRSTRDQLFRNTAVSALEIRGLLRQSALQSVEPFYTTEEQAFLARFECGRTPGAEEQWTQDHAYALHVYFSHFEFVFDAFDLGLITRDDWLQACSDLVASLNYCLFNRYWTTTYAAKPAFKNETKLCSP